MLLGSIMLLIVVPALKIVLLGKERPQPDSVTP
jgi:hypothetical protein